MCKKILLSVCGIIILSIWKSQKSQQEDISHLTYELHRLQKTVDTLKHSLADMTKHNNTLESVTTSDDEVFGF